MHMHPDFSTVCYQDGGQRVICNYDSCPHGEEGVGMQTGYWGHIQSVWVGMRQVCTQPLASNQISISMHNMERRGLELPAPGHQWWPADKVAWVDMVAQLSHDGHVTSPSPETEGCVSDQGSGPCHDAMMGTTGMSGMVRLIGVECQSMRVQNEWASRTGQRKQWDFSSGKWIVTESHKRRNEQAYQNKTWSLVTRPTNCNIIGSMWVFLLNNNTGQNHQRHKARLVQRVTTNEQDLNTWSFLCQWYACNHRTN